MSRVKNFTLAKVAFPETCANLTSENVSGGDGGNDTVRHGNETIQFVKTAIIEARLKRSLGRYELETQHRTRDGEVSEHLFH